MVPGAGLEPAQQDESPADFKSAVSTNSTTRASSKAKRWRLEPELNRRGRLCRPLHNHSAIQPTRVLPGGIWQEGSGAGNEIRTRDPNLGKVVLYQLSYSRLLNARMALPKSLIAQRQSNSSAPFPQAFGSGTTTWVLAFTHVFRLDFPGLPAGSTCPLFSKRNASTR